MNPTQNLSQTQLQELANKADEVLARKQLATFCLRLNPRLRFQRFHRLICEYMEAAERGDIRDLMIFVPPRHGKTEIVSNAFPAWVMGRQPTSKIILASYNADLAVRNSRIARNKLEEPAWPFPEVRIPRDSSAAGRWGTEDGGEVLAAGVGGGITGFGADYLIIDDPFKGREEADNVREQERVWNWYREDASPRRMPKGRRILVMTRWHKGDLAGRILNEPNAMNRWTVLELPAVCDRPGDPLGRKLGDPLDPERFPIEELELFREDAGARGWAALYQQQPTSERGAVFEREWWQTYDLDRLLKRGLRPSGIFLDTSFGEAGSDYSVAAVWGSLDGRYYLMDLWRKRVSYPDLRREMFQLYTKWKCPIVIEDVGTGRVLLQELRQGSSAQHDLPSIPTIPFKLPGRSGASGRLLSKEQRARLVTDLVEGGLVYLPEDARFVEDFLIEHTDFPMGRHDDQVDTTTMALMRLGEARDETFSVFGQSVPVRYRSA